MILPPWQAEWLGGLALRGPEGVLLIDAPNTLRLPDDWATQVRGVVLTSGRIDAISGLLRVLADATGPVHVLHGLHDDRTPALLGLWAQTWRGAEVLADAAPPGTELDICGAELTLHPLAGAERISAEVRPATTHGLHLRLPNHTIAYLPSARASATANRLCADAHLAVITVGARDWPRTDAVWRTRVDEAARIGASAGELWIVGDDGERWEGAVC